MADGSERISLPTRVHEFLLGLAGRIDDDALTDARELLAVAELDRAIELVAGTLVAGRVPVSGVERDRLRELIDAVRCAPALAERLVVSDDGPRPRHRFTPGSGDDLRPDIGLLDAIDRVLSVLPDIRSVFCVWRTTPAGATAGPVPQRLVLIETGTDGFAPPTAYRVEQALRRVGMNAAVEVLASGADHGEYHRAALAVARRVAGGTTSEPRPAAQKAAPAAPVSPVSARSAASPPDTRPSLDTDSSSAARPPAVSAPAPAPVPAPLPAVALPEPPASSGPLSSDMSLEPPAPRSVTSTRRRSAHAAPDRRPAVGSASGRWQRRIAGANDPAEPQPEPGQPAATDQPGAPDRRAQAEQQTPVENRTRAENRTPGDQRDEPAQQGRAAERTRPNTSPVSGPADRSPVRNPEAAGRDLPTAVPPNLAPPNLVPPNDPKAPAAGSTAGHRRPPQDLTADQNRPPRPPVVSPPPGAPAGHPSASPDGQAASSSAQQPRAQQPRGQERRGQERPAQPQPSAPQPSAAQPEPSSPSPLAPPSAQKPPATPTSATGGGKRPSGSSADEDLSQRERDLLRQLHEELAKREQGGQPPNQDGSPVPSGWQVDKSANRQSPFANPTPGDVRPESAAAGHWQAAAAGEHTPVNGVPPYGATT